MEYGTGAIFGCPGHDERDHEFATKYGLPIIPVVMPEDADAASFSVAAEPFVEDGVIINSDFLNGLAVEDAKAKVDRAAGGDGRRQGHDAVPPARLAGVAPALLGLPDPGHPLRQVRRRAGAGEGPAGRAARGCRVRPAGQSARPPSDLEARRLPDMRRRGAARDRHASTPSSIRAGTSTASPRRGSRRRRSTARRTTTGCRSTSISAASSTRSCTCSIRASGRAPCARCR